MSTPMMPMATAVWLVDNTSLTFQQIGDFCDLHELEVQGIADGTVGQHIVGLDPVAQNQLTQQEIERCQKDPSARLQLKEDAIKTHRRTKGPRYTPVSKRQDKPDAIAWLLRHHPELSDAQISRLVGTTKPTIQSIKERSHWNISNIKPVDPVALGLCKQTELDEAVAKAAARQPQAPTEPEPLPEEVLTPVTRPEEPTPSREEPTVESVFGPSRSGGGED
ncbi:MAG: DUF1013 domain-containing protein [Rhodothalassiaceae bacterium]